MNGIFHDLELLWASLSTERAAELDAVIRNLIADFTPVDPRTFIGLRVKLGAPPTSRNRDEQ